MFFAENMLAFAEKSLERVPLKVFYNILCSLNLFYCPINSPLIFYTLLQLIQISEQLLNTKSPMAFSSDFLLTLALKLQLLQKYFI